MFPSEQIKRLINCSLDISRLKIAVVIFLFMQTFCAIFNTKAVFPIEGRAAIKIKSDGCKPAVLWSKSIKPVSRPVTLFLFLKSFSSFSIVSSRISSIG